MDDRNPYVLLGIPFGAGRDVATRAFARKAKGRRRTRVSDDRAGLTDLTWALNQASDTIRDPRTALGVYRVPADPVALEPEGHGVLRPAPEPMPRTTPVSGGARGRLFAAARDEALAVLHDTVAASATPPAR